TKVHLFNNAVLWVYNGGSINVQGTANDPVIFQGTRLEQDYQDVPGQWGKIWLSSGSKNNVFNYAIIKNGIIGIQVDTLGGASPTLIIKNTIIRNMSVAGLLVQGSYVKGWNCVFSNCGQYVMVLNHGGTYDFRQCTFANYWQNSIRQTPLLKINNYYVDVNGKIQFRALNKAYFGNCILYGNIESGNEIDFDNATNDTIGFNFNFTNCLLKLKDYNSIYKNKFTNCIFNQEPYFINPNNYNFELQNNSPAINNGDPQIILPYAWLHADIKGKSRVSDAAPDIGAYEK
ncbi:MAG: choice-of-anchor Q domain-containing protein, partial [Bacteroidota bacterium]|nr:choice-of-anchor Q domain-containing protein [Bacteroidota bacterium]